QPFGFDDVIPGLADGADQRVARDARRQTDARARAGEVDVRLDYTVHLAQRPLNALRAVDAVHADDRQIERLLTDVVPGSAHAGGHVSGVRQRTGIRQAEALAGLLDARLAHAVQLADVALDGGD